jgi:tetratricopeptide (TPR) repeat protein
MVVQNPIVQLLNQIRTRIYDQMQRGELHYFRDMHTLGKHLQIAREMNDSRLIALTHNMMGIIESRMGNFEKAEGHFQDTYAAAALIEDYGLMSSAHNNLGEMYRRLGNQNGAVRAYEKARQLANVAGNTRKRHVADSNLGLAWLSLEDYANAESCFRRVFEEDGLDPAAKLPALIQAECGMAEICRERGDFASGWDYLRNSERLAQERDDKILMALVYQTQAHLAEADPQKSDQAAAYYKRANETLRLAGTPLSSRAQILLEEARYQQRHHHNPEAIKLAQEALTIFQGIQLDGDAKIAAEFLASLRGLA